MRKAIVLMLSMFIVQGCATGQEKAPSSYSAGLKRGNGESHTNTGQNPHAGQWAVAIVGTPVYLALKTMICGASLVIAAPAAAVTALSDNPHAMGVDQLGDGVAANCGPPYVLSPS